MWLQDHITVGTEVCCVDGRHVGVALTVFGRCSGLAGAHWIAGPKFKIRWNDSGWVEELERDEIERA